MAHIIVIEIIHMGDHAIHGPELFRNGESDTWDNEMLGMRKAKEHVQDLLWRYKNAGLDELTFYLRLYDVGEPAWIVTGVRS